MKEMMCVQIYQESCLLWSYWPWSGQALPRPLAVKTHRAEGPAVCSAGLSCFPIKGKALSCLELWGRVVPVWRVNLDMFLFEGSSKGAPFSRGEPQLCPPSPDPQIFSFSPAIILPAPTGCRPNLCTKEDFLKSLSLFILSAKWIKVCFYLGGTHSYSQASFSLSFCPLNRGAVVFVCISYSADKQKDLVLETDMSLGLSCECQRSVCLCVCVCFFLYRGRGAVTD